MLKTPDEWLEDEEFVGILILDPDGWDRRPDKWDESWGRPITREEMRDRVNQSTIAWKLAGRAKTHPLVIEILWEYEGGMIGLMSKGHHSTADFVQAATQFLSKASFVVQEELSRHWWDGEVKMGWWRFIPVRDGDQGMLWDAKPHTRGAYPVTYARMDGW